MARVAVKILSAECGAARRTSEKQYVALASCETAEGIVTRLYQCCRRESVKEPSQVGELVARTTERVALDVGHHTQPDEGYDQYWEALHSA